MDIIAYIRTDFPTKFGIPRQSGLIEGLKGTIVFEPAYRNPEAVRGLDGFNYIWLIWQFSESKREHWAATVKPPRLGGKTRVGVFATRSPYRPNPIGLSSVRLEGIEITKEYGPVLHVSGADLMDHTPIYDIKPYIPFADCHTDATDGFTSQTIEHELVVEFQEGLLELLPIEKREAAIGILRQDPRPGYDIDETRFYGIAFAGFDLRFQVIGDTLRVCQVVPLI